MKAPPARNASMAAIGRMRELCLVEALAIGGALRMADSPASAVSCGGLGIDSMLFSFFPATAEPPLVARGTVSPRRLVRFSGNG